MIPEPAPFPRDVSAMSEFRPFPPSFRWLQLVRSAPFCLAATLVWVGIGVAVGMLTAAGAGVACGLVGAVAAGVGGVWWTAEATRRRSWMVGDAAVELQMGVWWRTHAVLPRSRVQNVTVATGPVRNLLGLVSVVVHSAGAATPNIVLHGVDPVEGNWIHQSLLGARSPAPSTTGADGADGVSAP